MSDATDQASAPTIRSKRVRTPTVLQMEAVECGAAALGIILAYHGRVVPLEELRTECGVSRDGSKASNVVRAARKYGLEAKGYKKELSVLGDVELPFIVFWNFNHFVVVEGFKRGQVYLNDPAAGPRQVSWEEFDAAFTGIVLTFAKTPDFKKGGQRPSLTKAIVNRLSGSRGALGFVALASLCLIVPGVVVPTFTRVFVDDVLIGGMDTWFAPLLVGMGLALVLRCMLTWLREHYLLRLESKMALSTSSRFFWHILRLPMQFFTQRYGGEIGQRVELNDQVALLLSGQFARAFLNVATLAFYAIVMFYYDALLTLIAVLIASVNMLFLHLVARRRVDANQKLLQERGKLMAASMGGLQMIETLKATGGEADFFAKWSGYQAKVLNAEQELGVSVNLLSIVPPFLTALSTVAILGIGGLRVMDGHLSIGMLVAFQSLMASFVQPVNELVTFGGMLQDMHGYMNRLDDVLRYPIEEALGQEAPQDTAESVGHKLSGHVELRDVTFGYSPLEKPLIEEFSLTLKPGARVALVGASGSGKSTISRLVAGLFDPWSGEILFDHQPRQSLARGLVNNSLAIVDQEICQFEGTIRDNVTLWDQTVLDGDIVQAAKDSNIHEVVAARPRGYESHVTEGGANFSGGQRQRLELARALAGNPTILVLDEATSALDPVTEQIVDDHIRRRGCTCLIVAHRLSTIRDADEIVVLDRGKVVQRGTHEEMKDADGPYAKLIGAE